MQSLGWQHVLFFWPPFFVFNRIKVAKACCGSMWLRITHPDPFYPTVPPQEAEPLKLRIARAFCRPKREEGLDTRQGTAGLAWWSECGQGRATEGPNTLVLLELMQVLSISWALGSAPKAQLPDPWLRGTNWLPN